MKEKILKAIDKGLMNVLSTDITDHDIDFDHDNLDNEYIPYDARPVDMGNAGIWCEYNLGARPGLKPEDWYGNYYAWGEIVAKSEYSWKTYKYCEGIYDTLTKYNEDDCLTRLETNDDIVTLTLGNKFRMPTKDEYEKLVENTTNKWIEKYNGIQGLNGRLFTAENGNTLFFPATGYYDYSDLHDAGVCGNLWSASLYSNYPNYARYLYFGTDRVELGGSDLRGRGLPVRGIQWFPLN